MILVALSLGIRHGFDVDHLATIDAIARIVRDNRLVSKLTGVLFSLGHGLVVTIASVIIGSGLVQSHIPQWLDGLGNWISIFFLLVFGFLNFWNLFRPQATFSPSPVIVREDGRTQGASSYCNDQAIQEMDDRWQRELQASVQPMLPVGIRSYLAQKIMRKNYGPLLIAGIGALFALSFDTISQIALFSISASLLSGWIFSGVLGVFFMLGMMISDGFNGLIVSTLIQRADSTSIRLSRGLGYVISLFSLATGIIGIWKIIQLQSS